MKGYVEFRKTLEGQYEQNDIYIKNPELFKEKFKELIGKDVSAYNQFMEYNKMATKIAIDDLEESKIFEVDEPTKEALIGTDNQIYVRPLPFDKFFIDTEIIIDGITFSGFLVVKDNVGIIIRTFADFFMDTNIPEALRRKKQMVNIPLDENKKEIAMLNKIQEINPLVAGLKQLKQREQIKKFICNFLDFLNHPDIEMRVVKWDNENRIKKGKCIIPDKAIIKINGKLYRYIYEELPIMRVRESPSYTFWVRGHYMHFWDKDKWIRIYGMNIISLKEEGYQIDEDGLIKKWIFAYIKGIGEPKESIRLVKKDVK